MPQATVGPNISDTAQINPGVIVNSDINDSAAIAYSKLALALSIVNADIATNAAIAYSKLALALSIVNADIATNAAIVDTKLAQIATASKVSGAAITSLSSLPSGAGVIPSANLPGSIVHAAGTAVVASSDAEATQQNIGALTEVKAFIISAAASGTVTVDFDGHDDVSGGAEARIYVNAAAVGTLRQYGGNTTYQTFSENIAVVAGDRVSLYWGTTVANKQNFVRNFRIKSTKYEVTTRVVGSA